MKALCVLCDDVRFELGNKITIVGLYGSLVLAEPENPIISPFKLFTRIIMSPDEKVKKVTIKVNGPLQEDTANAVLDIQAMEARAKLPRNYDRFYFHVLDAQSFILPPSGGKMKVVISADDRVIVEEDFTFRLEKREFHNAQYMGS